MIRRLGGAKQAAAGAVGGTVQTPTGGGGQMAPAAGARMSGTAGEASGGKWTEALVADFLAGLDPAARRVARQVWSAGAAGIHRSVLCQHAELTPAALRTSLARMGQALRRLQRERGVTLPRPVAANSPLQSYFVDADFAAAANSRMFDERMGQPRADGVGSP